jgi:hypothetical protein
MSGHRPWRNRRPEPSDEAKAELEAEHLRERRKVASACPSCGTVAERTTYDIGDGPELSCASCEWCWGADAYTYARVVDELGYDPMDPTSNGPADPGDGD